MDPAKRVATCTVSIVSTPIQFKVAQIASYVTAIASDWLKPAAANWLRVVSKSVLGSGTPKGPASSASTRPVRRAIASTPSEEPVQVETAATIPWFVLVKSFWWTTYTPNDRVPRRTYKSNVICHTQICGDRLQIWLVRPVATGIVVSKRLQETSGTSQYTLQTVIRTSTAQTYKSQGIVYKETGVLRTVCFVGDRAVKTTERIVSGKPLTKDLVKPYPVPSVRLAVTKS
jgi:hypothetical protein